VAGFRLPGFLCVVTNAMPIDAGTLPRTAFPHPGPVGGEDENHLSAYELALARKAGRRLDGSVRPLRELLALRDDHLREIAKQTRELGTKRWHGGVAFLQAANDALDELIKEARSPAGRAAEALESLIEKYEENGSPITDEQLSKAFEEPLARERQAQLAGTSDGSGGSKVMALLVRGLDAAAERNNAALEKLLVKAELPGSPVTDGQLREAFQKVLGIERQRQLLGATDENARGPRAMDLVGRGVALSVRRKNDALKDRIEKARRPSSPVTNEQLREAMREALEAERQAQLLGVPDTGAGSGGPALVVDAARVLHERTAAALARLLADPAASEGQIRQATATFEDEKKQLRLLGVDVPDGTVGEGPMRIHSR